MSAVCSHLQQRQHSSVYATWGVPVHSVAVAVAAAAAAVVVAAAAAELVPLAGLLAARRSVLGLHLVLDLMPVLDLARELGPEPEPAGCDVAARRTFVVVIVPALLSLFDLDFVPPVPSPCTTAYWRRPYWALHKLVDLSFVEGMHGGVAGFGVGAEAEAGLAEAGQRTARVDVENENCWAPYCQRLPSRAKRAKAQHGETKLRH